MDQAKIGQHLAALRRSAGMTQETLAEHIGVTNKTISRWETGRYLPDIEALALLAKEFGTSVDALLVGESAAENTRPAPKPDMFSRREREAYFRKKWRREHIWLTAAVWEAAAALAAAGLVLRRPYQIGAGALIALAGHMFLNNRMMAYVEEKLYC